MSVGIYNSHIVTVSNHDAKRAALDLDLDLDLLLISGAPSNHAGRNSTGIWGVNRQGCRFSRPAPWMARGGGPPNPCRITGTPSLGEVPSGGARAFGLLLRFSKVTRCKSGTNSGRYRRNGYVHGLIQHPGRLSGRHRGQAPSHIFCNCSRQLPKGLRQGKQAVEGVDQAHQIDRFAEQIQHLQAQHVTDIIHLGMAGHHDHR